MRAEELIEFARADPWVQSQLEGTDNRVVQVLDPGKGGPIVWLVDYTNRRSIAIEFSADQGSITARSVDEIGVPEISLGEKSLAVQIALQDGQVRERVGGDAQLSLNNITGAGGPDCVNSRCVAVFLDVRSDDAHWAIVAIVDLRTKTVTEILQP